MSRPDFIGFDTMLKATPKTEGENRFIYLEASGEGIDIQRERVLSKALEESAEYFLKFGNIDIDHYTILGPRLGIPDYMSYEVGVPVDVDVKNNATFVKVALYQGDTPGCARANMIWDSLTGQNPPARWYPSVGGNIQKKTKQVDPETGGEITVIEKVLWNNIGLSRTPVNPHLPAASAMPVGIFAKSLNAFTLSKALEASYATDMASLTGGGAFAAQSIDVGHHMPYSYFDFRDRISGAIQAALVSSMTRDGLIAYTMNEFNLPQATADEWVSRFLSDIQTSLI